MIAPANSFSATCLVYRIHWELPGYRGIYGVFVGVRTSQRVSVGRGVQVGRKVEVGEGSLVDVGVGKGFGVRVGVWLGQEVSVGWMVGPVGVLVNVCAGLAVRVGGSGVSVKGRVAVGKESFVADGVELTVVPGGLPVCLL